MDFVLYLNTPVLCETAPPVSGAVDILRRDLQSVLMQESGSPGRIEINISNPRDVYDESYVITVKESKIDISARSELGAVYAVLRISRDFLGVHPLWFWTDNPPKKREEVSVPCGEYASKPYRVRFRGWFLNDEVLMETWRPVPERPEYAWRMAFEALLRLGGNMVIPGTDHNSRKYRSLAAEMGLWITHHHAEPLGAELFSRAYPELEPVYAKHAELFIKLWREGVVSQAACNVIWALGFRGQGDRPFWEDDPQYDTPEKRGALISKVIRQQYDLVKEAHRKPVCCVNLYGEILELHRQGLLALPEGVIKIWADSGYGKMVSRRQINHNPRIPSLPTGPGPHGIYYHASFYDLQASGHITMLPNPTGMVRDELKKAFAAGACEYLLVNCGNIRPHVYMLDLLAQIWIGKETETDKLLEEYGESTIQYGEHPDEKAGEQFYHHPARELAAAWMQGKAAVESLNWLCIGSFDDQFAHYETLLEKGLPLLKAYAQKCKDTGSQLWLQARIHMFGAEGALWLCRAFRAFKAGDTPCAFCCAWRAKQSYTQTLADFAACEHGVWNGFYDNECLTDIRLSVMFMETLMAWLRLLGEGADRQLWHRLYLMDKADRGVMLVTNFYRPLPDDELAKGITKVIC